MRVASAAQLAVAADNRRRRGLRSHLWRLQLNADTLGGRSSGEMNRNREELALEFDASRDEEATQDSDVTRHGQARPKR